MPKKPNKEKAYCGIDESNHGSSPEIFVAVISEYPSDTTISSRHPKRIQNPHTIFGYMRKRDWKYTIVSRKHYDVYGPHKIIVRATELLLRELKSEFGSLEIYIDGELQRRQITEINRSFPGIHTKVSAIPKGKKFRRTNQLIQLADSLANYLFRKKTPEELINGKLSRRKVTFR